MKNKEKIDFRDKDNLQNINDINPINNQNIKGNIDETNNLNCNLIRTPLKNKVFNNLGNNFNNSKTPFDKNNLTSKNILILNKNINKNIENIDYIKGKKIIDFI